ncbi:hypothetical protein CLV59_104488 [Chitinophaga dinghuensis]|uniref:DUF4625 domain-containing protein n=1 Tax=Chitinophaga dinghuensis TaxID=1539050 RepID=A0A327W0T7_9BACT|nr:hypothetical protein [Chitinophaga dinghuensis]RAJ82263.1 hypothetical protein CLV59_104488 [Chitinophaga dinghuensis]
MKKLTYISACLVSVLLYSCTKNNDDIKLQLEKALPNIEVTSMGLLRQTGPFAPADVIQVTFGGAITKADPGTLDFAWYDVPTSGKPALVDSIHFASWNVTASAATGNSGVSTTLTPASYPNTNIISGNLNLKLSKLVSGKSYSLFIYVRTTDNKVASVSQTKFVTMK